ncbi:GNAT family N-acetyltransferase [Paenibacillus pinihumi]|uniref:GNAT family N-acetyltransferase n=1 Tax=Paenibacillus pinihumi TaxID=669462 RepID=UPI000418DE89|nr:GNAT family N-acetyltransferase [Paenibacillus pinihumi]
MPDMLVKLYELPELAPLLMDLREKGITIRRGMPPEKHNVIAWVKKEFNEYWASECEFAYAQQPNTCLLAVKEEPGSEKGTLIGFACYNATAKGFFGPTGVSPEARGLGAGKALLIAALHAMREDGYGYGIIGAAGPTEFYAKTVGATEIPDSVPGIYRGMQ